MINNPDFRRLLALKKATSLYNAKLATLNNKLKLHTHCLSLSDFNSGAWFFHKEFIKNSARG